MSSDHPFLTKRALLDAIRMTCGIDYVLTLSSPLAGAAIHGMHFQAMPKQVQFPGKTFNLFSWLEDYGSDGGGNSVEMLKDYPATCLRISGEYRFVQEKVWYLAENYNKLESYNLIICGIDQEHLRVYFFPRPFSPKWEGPEAVANFNWSFGAFEMGGFFLIGDKKLFETIATGGKNLLNQYLEEASVHSESEEMNKVQELLSNVKI